MSRRAVFWASAAGGAAVFTALVPFLFPFGPLGLDADADRRRVWLLTVFTAGVLAVLFGASSLLAGPRQLNVRDVAEAGGSVDRARESARRARGAGGEGYERNFALWCVAAGGFLLAGYFALWLSA